MAGRHPHEVIGCGRRSWLERRPHLLIMKRFAYITAAVSLAMPGAAQAVTIQTTDTSRPWQAWANAAQVPTYASTLPLTVADGEFGCGGFNDAEGCTSILPTVDQTSGEIQWGNGQATVSTTIDESRAAVDVRGTFYHELGQVFWGEYMTPADETRFMSIVGLPGDSTDWTGWIYTTKTNGVTITFSPYEWFAEGYRYCAEYGVNQPPNVNDYEGLGYPGDKPRFAAQQREVCELIDEVGLDNAIATPAQHVPRFPGRVIRARVRVGRACSAWRTAPCSLEHLSRPATRRFDID